MSQRSPLSGIATLLIDGNNLLHRTSGSADPSALRQLIARLRGVLNVETSAIVMLDGHAAPGTGRQQRVAPNLEIHHAGSMTADDALLGMIRHRTAHTRSGITLVTDDRALTDKARHLGAHTQRLQWLEQLLAAGDSAPVGIGGGKRPQQQPIDHDDPERKPWKPGRGATTKRGNPRRGRR